MPEERILFFSCYHEDECMASIEGSEKYVYHYDNWPEEFFDLSEDPLEERNLAEERSGEVNERREDLFEWRSRLGYAYGDG